MYNRTIIRFGFCDNQNNQGLGKGYIPYLNCSTNWKVIALIHWSVHYMALTGMKPMAFPTLLSQN